mmetsp:Transcript_23369/g.55405  ORF Transcript_23369/g.55405 Transcript_23369/m.55405 type:complete len:85 (+) Transcript_23369:1103-1357(+)
MRHKDNHRSWKIMDGSAIVNHLQVCTHKEDRLQLRKSKVFCKRRLVKGKRNQKDGDNEPPFLQTGDHKYLVVLIDLQGIQRRLV